MMTPAERARYVEHCRTERAVALLDARLQQWHGRLDARDGAVQRACSYHESVVLALRQGAGA